MTPDNTQKQSIILDAQRIISIIVGTLAILGGIEFLIAPLEEQIKAIKEDLQEHKALDGHVSMLQEKAKLQGSIKFLESRIERLEQKE